MTMYVTPPPKAPTGTLAFVWATDEHRLYSDAVYAAAVSELVGTYVPMGSRVDARVLEDADGTRALFTTDLPTGRVAIAQLPEGTELP